LYDGLRHDPEFQLISSFGPVGVGVVPYRDHSNAAIRERRLPPVEIYKLRSPGSLARTVDAKPIILAGDTNAWPNLHGDGLVDTYQPLVTSGAIADADIASELTASRGVVVTDTGRRRLRRLISYEPTYSFTLGRSQQTGRTVRELFPAVPTAESTAWFADASDISPVGMGVSGISTWASPGNAFDGDPSTYWGVNWALAPGTPGIKVTFRAPHVLSRLDLTALLSADGVSSIQRAVIVLSDGSRHKVSFDATGSAHLSFAPTSTSSLLVMLDQVDAHQGFVGLTEVSVPGVDLRQFVEPGTDLFGGRAAAPELTAVMASTPTVYSFQRSARASYLDDPNYAASRFDEEHALRRRFTVVHTGRYQVQGTLRLTGLTPDTKLNGVVGGAVSATASASNPTDSSGQPMHALDGLLTSAWIAKRPIGEHITVAVPRQRVQRVQVISDSDGAGAAISVITVTVAGVSHSMMMNPDPWCPAYTLADLAAIKLRQQQVGPQPAEAPSEVTKQPCHRTATLDLPEPVDADQVQVSLDATDRRANPFGVEGHVDEVRVSGPDHTAAENTVDLAAPVDGSCVDLGLRIARSPVAGAGYPIPLSFHTTVGDLLTGVPVKFTGCSPASLSSGVDYLDSGPNGWIDSVALVSADWPAAASSDASTSTPVPVRFQGSGVADTRVSTTQATTFVLGQSFDPLWTLSVDGGKPVAASAVDGLNGWPLPAGTHDLVLRYRPEWGLSVAILVTLASVIACVVLVIGRRRRPVLADGADLADDHVAVGVVTRRASTIAVVLATLVGVSLVGVWALLVGVVVLAVVRFYDEPVDVTGVAAPVLFALAGATSVVMLFTGSNPLSLQYPKDRSLAHHFTVVAMVFAVQTVALLSLSARAAVRRHVVFGPRRGISDVARSWWHAVERPWAVCALVVGAAAARVLVSGHASSTASADQLVRNIRLGSEYTSAVFTGPLAVDLAPLAPTVRAMLRLTPALLAAVTMVCTMAALVVWARRRLPAVPSWQVAVVCLVSPLTWGVGLGGQLAALAVVSAALLLDVERPSTGAVAAAGLFLGAAVLARPDAVLLWLVVIVWMLRRHRFVHASIVTVVGVLTIAPWANNVWSAGSAPWLAGSVRAMVLDQAVTGVARWSTWWVALLFVAVLLVVLQRRGARTQALAAEQ
ncbi:MAG: hypothetical protein WCI22_06835, partial [Actinomycetota bacterium]